MILRTSPFVELLSYISIGSMQHMGDTMLEVTRAYANAEVHEKVLFFPCLELLSTNICLRSSEGNASLFRCTRHIHGPVHQDRSQVIECLFAV